MDPITVAGSLFTVLGTVIGVLWKIFLNDRAKQTAKHEECEKDRTALWGVVNSGREELAVFKGCQTEKCGAIESLRRKEAFERMLNNKNVQ